VSRPIPTQMAQLFAPVHSRFDGSDRVSMIYILSHPSRNPISCSSLVAVLAHPPPSAASLYSTSGRTLRGFMVLPLGSTASSPESQSTCLSPSCSSSPSPSRRQWLTMDSTTTSCTYLTTMRVKKAGRCTAACSVAVAGLVTAGGAWIRRRLLWIEVNLHLLRVILFPSLMDQNNFILERTSSQ
jgi:hypothetical protein